MAQFFFQVQQQVQTVLAGELANFGTPLQFNPYLGESEFTDSWRAQLGEALAGTITFEEMLTRIETDVNAQIQDDRIYLPVINR